MSIFSGWDRESLLALKDALTASPEGLGALALVCLIGMAAIAAVCLFVSHKVGGFFTRVQEEEEQARLEEMEEETRRVAGEGEKGEAK
jgi:hypothetical protein